LHLFDAAISYRACQRRFHRGQEPAFRREQPDHLGVAADLGIDRAISPDLFDSTVVQDDPPTGVVHCHAGGERLDQRLQPFALRFSAFQLPDCVELAAELSAERLEKGALVRAEFAFHACAEH